jgi:hypothetical protein
LPNDFFEFDWGGGVFFFFNIRLIVVFVFFFFFFFFFFFPFAPSQSPNRWYLLPWDLDGAWFDSGWGPLQDGFANWWAVPFWRRYLRRPSNVASVAALVRTLHAQRVAGGRAEALVAAFLASAGLISATTPPDSDSGSRNAAQMRASADHILARLSATLGDFEASLARPMPTLFYMVRVASTGAALAVAWVPGESLAGREVRQRACVAATERVTPACDAGGASDGFIATFLFACLFVWLLTASLPPFCLFVCLVVDGFIATFCLLVCLFVDGFIATFFLFVCLFVGWLVCLFVCLFVFLACAGLDYCFAFYCF